MKLTIDGRAITAMPDEALLDLVRRLGLLTGRLSDDPLAAKIAGEVFTLNYVPVRRKDVYERESMRRAMAASGGVVRLLRYKDHTGRDAYTRTAQFVLFYAAHRLWKQARVKMRCNVGSGLYFKVTDAPDFSAERLKEEVRRIVESDIPLCRRSIPTSEAIRYYNERGQTDKARLLAYREAPTLDVYEYDGFADYYYGEMAPSTGFLRVWDILPAPDGFVFVFPDPLNPDRLGTPPNTPKLLEVYFDGKNWCELMKCETVADLNQLVDSGRIRELIRVNEALLEKRFSAIADRICEKGSRAVLLSGPSSSGKTTSANRLATQLRVHGKTPILMSLDDYYIDRDRIPDAEDGSVDLEHINTIDTALFGEHLQKLLSGEEVELPSFCFKSGKRKWLGHRLRLEESSVIIIEGLHALNPILLPQGVNRELIFKLFVCPLLPLNLDDHNRIPSNYLRLLRRIVRDFETRNSSVQNTISMWNSVRRGEVRWIYPFQEQADVILNSSTLYELAVLKKHIFPLLTAVSPEDECYDEVRGIVKILNFIHTADVDDEIPPTSLVREFIGGNTFYR
ncbi:MAG: nucleoside kinase [Ruminococcaceae bacterium]|nr:nucleoside kinase [Oscillospiraceae bacterium]